MKGILECEWLGIKPLFRGFCLVFGPVGLLVGWSVWLRPGFEHYPRICSTVQSSAKWLRQRGES